MYNVDSTAYNIEITTYSIESTAYKGEKTQNVKSTDQNGLCVYFFELGVNFFCGKLIYP